MFVIPLVLAVYALVDVVQTPESEIREGLPKLLWVALVVLFWVVGPIAWLVAGKKPNGTSGVRRPTGWPPGVPRSGPPRQVAPDDDPEFLSQLERERGRRERERRRREREGGTSSRDSSEEQADGADGSP